MAKEEEYLDFENIPEQKSKSVNRKEGFSENLSESHNWTEDNEKKLASIIEEIKNTEKRLREINHELEGEKTTEKSEEKPALKSKERLEEKEYSPEYIKEKIQKLLSTEKHIQKINLINVEGRGGQLIITIDFEAKVVKEIKGIIAVNFTNDKGKIVAGKDLKVKANFLDKVAIKTFIGPKLKEVYEKLKEFIENEENYEVESMRIENSKLKVDFKK